MIDYAAAALAPGTARIYARQWAYFKAHCADVGLPARVTKPAVLTCLARRASEVSASTTASLLSGIRWYARHHGDVAVTYDPDVFDVMAGLYRLKPPRRHPPVTDQDVAEISRQFGDAPLDRRDRALLLVIAHLMLPLRVLSQLSRTDLCFDDEGLTLRIRTWNGRPIRIEHEAVTATCVVCALARWVAVPGPDPAGPLFVGRSLRGGFLRTAVGHNLVNDVLQRAAFRTYCVPFAISSQIVRANAIREATRSGHAVALSYRLGFRNVSALLGYSLFGESSRTAVLAVRRARGRPWFRR